MAPSIQNIINHRDDILKAEIISWFALMDKTKIEWWQNKGYLSHLSPESTLLNSIDDIISSKFANWKININFFKTLAAFDITANDFMNNNWRSWRKINLTNQKEYVLQVLYGLGEGLNSGIDKGAPKAQLINNKLWISNAFGKWIKNVDDKDLFDKKRQEVVDNIDISKPIHILRKELYEILKSWLSKLLADTRYPVNDITLWEQTYMPSSMFKATLAGFYYSQDLDPNTFDPRTVKWSILGIQYDKLGLAEKGLKVGNIQWYRETAELIDNEIKYLLEIDFPIGNEIYRDETGIYFLISDKFVNLTNEIPKLNCDIKDKLENEIFSIFSYHTENEFYPYIAVSEPSRGLMQLTTLLQQAKENFLKAPQPRVPIMDFSQYQDQPVRGVCQVCGMRLATKSSGVQGETYICDTCLDRRSGRVNEWINNLEGETIWTDELRDKNDRIALVTLKFELQEWLNGEFLSTMVENIKESYHFSLMVETLKVIKNLKIKGAFDISYFDDEEKFIEIETLILPISIDTLEKQFDKNSGYINRKVNNRIRVQFDFVNKKLLDKSSGSPLTNSQINSFRNKISDFVKKYSFKIFKELSKDAYNSKDVKTIDDLFKQIFFGNVIDTTWKDFIKQNFFELFPKLDFENQIIIFKELTEQDIIDLSRFLLQFLLRKNPSPARLYRIWNNTKEFLEEVKNELINNVLNDDDRKRLIWNLDDNQKQSVENALHELYKDKKGYLYSGNLQFWYQNGTVYQISYSDLPEQIQLKTENGNQILTLQKSDAQPIQYKPYFSIIEPTPISWQFIIPADKLPELIKLVQDKYNQHFHWVYGKLPLHIGIIIQDYKRPLYVGIKALRQIRRDGVDYCQLSEEIEAKDFKKNFLKNIKHLRKKYSEQISIEVINGAPDFYSLYFGTKQKNYLFYFPPHIYPWKVNPILKIKKTDTSKLVIYPNTFDFEFLDSNARRNDIYYIKARRYVKIKEQRPYDLSIWSKFLSFRELFDKHEHSGRSARLHRLISLLYKEIDEVENLKIKDKIDVNFIKTAFINTLRLNSDQELHEKLKEVIDLDQLTDDNITDAIKLFLDMFEFWHTALKQV